jgi:hypothetical protein
MGRITLRLCIFAFGMALVGVYVAGCVPIPPASIQASSLRPIAVEAVQVQIGVGSPIPVDVFVSGTWPDLCAQLAEMTQHFTGSIIEIELLASPVKPDCPPDYLGLPFRIAIPLNVVELPHARYSVVVNGANTSFDWPASQ